LRKSRPYEQPVRTELEGERYTLNPALVDWAFRLTKDVPLGDTAAIRTGVRGSPACRTP
jgi:purine nucleoside permease